MTGQQIKTLRTLRNLTPDDLARLAQVSEAALAEIENQHREPMLAEELSIFSILSGRPLAKLEISADAEAESPQVEPPTAQSAIPLARPLRPVGMAAAASSNAIPTVKVGDDLNDPVKFSVMPDFEMLVISDANAVAYRERVTEALARAQKILHTPRVPAAVWRAWRRFEQQATECLRGQTTATAPATNPTTQKPSSVNRPDVAPGTSAKIESKSFNSLFVEAARDLLPPDSVEKLNHAAEAAHKADSSVGFMKHFRGLVETEIDPTLLAQLVTEAERRLKSTDRSRARRGRGRFSEPNHEQR